MFPRPRRDAFALILNTLMTLSPGLALAQVADRHRPTSMADALEQTAQQGRPCVLVLTSAANPQSRAAWVEVAKAIEAEGLAVNVAEWPVDRDPTYDPTTLPRLALFHRSDKGLALAGQKGSDFQASSTVSWIRSLGVVTQNPKLDAALSRTQYATPQTSAPVPQSIPVPPPSVMMAAPQAMPMVNVPTASAFGVSVPSASIVVSPSAPSVYVTPAPAPNIYMAQPVQQPSQLFVAAPLALPPSPVTQVGMMAATYAVAPQQAQAIAQAAPQVMILHSPGMLESLIGTIGEHLAKRKWPRVQVGSTPTLTTTIATQNMAYSAGPQSIPMSPQPVYVNPPSPPPTPMASPQSEQVPQARHGWFHKRP